MDAFEQQLSRVFLNSYHALGKLERTLALAGRGSRLSAAELYLLEAVAAVSSDNQTAGATVSELSEYMEISLPTVTAAVNKLQTKGYVQKNKVAKDARIVLVCFTRAGRRAERARQYFHRRLVRAVTGGLSRDEKRVLLKCVGKLELFLEQNIDLYSNPEQGILQERA